MPKRLQALQTIPQSGFTRVQKLQLCVWIMAIDAECLISFVFAKKPLWDQKLKLYRNRTVVDKLWKQVSTELGNATAEEAKKKWKSLRDAFGKELKKVPEGRSGDEAPLNYETYTTWPYFESMLFLKDQMRPRKSGGNLKVGGTEMIGGEIPPENELEGSVVLSNEEVDVQEIPESDCTGENLPRIEQRRGKRGAQQQLLAIEAKKLKLLEKKVQKAVVHDDEDESFFKSLLPHVRKLKPEQKLLFRMEVQKVVHKFVYSKNDFLNDPNQTGDVFRPSSSTSTAPYHHSTPVRGSTEFVDINPRTPPQSCYGDLPSVHDAEIVAIQCEGEQLNQPPIYSSARNYYTVITSPISSAGTNNQ